MNEMVEYNESALSMYDEPIRVNLDKFNKLISKNPNPAILKKNPFANNAKYLPIGIIQMKLDQIFLGAWEWKVTDTKIVANAITVSGDLRFFHPYIKQWITRSGVGAIPLELKKGSGANEAEMINSKAVSKNYPAANAEAFKNAAKTIGNMFGRSLNRDFNAEYKPEDNIDKILNEL